MTQEDFSGLSFIDKITTLYRSGTFVVAIRYYRYKVNLYLIGNFYVEVFFNHKQDRIDHIQLLDRQHSRFKFYADQIKLPGGLLD